MTGVEQPKVQYETGESPLLGQRAMVIPYPFGRLRFHLGKGTVAKKGWQLGNWEVGRIKESCCLLMKGLKITPPYPPVPQPSHATSKRAYTSLVGPLG